MKKTAAFLPILFLALSAEGSTLLSENFTGATPGGGSGPGGAYSGNIPGTQFTVTSDNVDIVGVVNGSNFSCVQNPTGNCLDLVGNEGGGQIQSVPTFSLVAGNVYTVTFEAELQGFTAGTTPTTEFSVSLGSMSQSESADPNGASYSLTFTPTTNQSGAELTFTTISAPDGVHGAVLSDIVLTDTPSSGGTAAPEPGMGGALLVSLAGLIAWKRSTK